jgi:hypothetical protein
MYRKKMWLLIFEMVQGSLTEKEQSFQQMGLK